MMAQKEVDLSRLGLAIQRSRLVLRRPREERREMVRQYVGFHWSEEGTNEKVPVNLLALYCGIVGRTLIAKDPRVLLSTFQKENKAAVQAMEAWVNREIQEMHLATTLQRIVFDALFSIGICKVALATPADSATVGWNLPAGQPFADRVDLDDFVFDTNARRFEDVTWIGHRFRAPLDVIRDSSLYSSTRKELVPSTDQPYNQEGDERISVLGRTYYAVDTEEFEDWVDLWEIYIPRRKLILTLADSTLPGSTSQTGSGKPRPLREVEWLGPDTGPYSVLGLGVVPGNIMPKGPIQDLIDLHEIVNRLYRKLGRQAERQKELGFVQGGASEDGTRVMQANDGDLIKVDNPDKINLVQMGGPHQGNFLFVDHLFQLFSKMAGNLEMMGGLAPQSKTATQDKMLNQNSSSQIASMQADVTNFTGGALKKLCWYWWNHPQQVMRVKHSLPGLPDVSITRELHPRGAMQPTGQPQPLQRRAKWADLEVNVDPYSLQDQTPQGIVAALQQIVGQTILPLMGPLQQQGIGLDLNAFLTMLGKYLNLPQLAEIVTIQEPPQGEEPPQPGGTKPAETTRNYVRRSLGNESEQGQGEDLRATLEKGMGQGQANGQLSPAGMP